MINKISCEFLKTEPQTKLIYSHIHWLGHTLNIVHIKEAEKQMCV